VTATVGDLLADPPGPLDVVVLDATLRAEPDPGANVRRLIGAGQRVLVIDASAGLNAAAAARAAGAHGYLTRDHGLAALAATLRGIAAGGTAWSPGAAARAGRALSGREHAVLVAYASGQR
jgi:two-component system, NarL family, nitrate/nitrite response regulator NarL